jgi:pimeloyl-ACP methyl ester carboxylesterase
MSTVARRIPISDSVSLTLEQAGDGEPLILLPGLGCSARSLQLLIPHLVARRFSVTAINPRGIAGSNGPLDGLTLHDLAADVANVIRELEYALVHVVGWAYGNRVARCVAVDAPDLVDTIILLGAGGLVPPDADVKDALSRLAAESPISEEDRRRYLRTVMLAPGSDPQLVEYVDLGLWPSATQAQRAAGLATPVEDWWAGGTKPVLVIQGLDDRAAPPANGHALRDRHGDRVYVVDLPNAGHGMVLEKPEAVAEAIDEWVRGRDD